MLIVTIAILVATHLYRRGLASIDKIKTLYNKIEALLNKVKKFTRDCLTGIDVNPDVYIPEIVRQL